MGSAKMLTLSGVLLACLLVPPSWASAAGPVVKAKAAILIDNQTGEVLWQRNPDVPLPNASTTKIVTAMVALQSGRLNDTVVVSPEAAQAPPSKINLRPGWEMRVRDLLYALLLNSANDSAVALAEGLSGSVPRFATRMNAVARALGAHNTHFVNPNGLPAEDHYSTARDLATMFARSLQNPIFEHIMSTKTTTITPVAGSRRHIALRSHNRLLADYRIQVLGKTGFTRAAKKCFVGAGRFGGREIGVAVLGSTDLWGDLKHLLEYGFGEGNMPEPAAPEMEVAAADADAAAGDDDETVSPPRRRSTYFLNVRSFRARNSAQRLKADLAKHGYPCRVRTVRHGRRASYQVLVGGYRSRNAAEQAASRLQKQHQVQPRLFVASQ
jgi:D-alanyl-D-alanine carboxypeptidase (penicillin-binding protein 5/6)